MWITKREINRRIEAALAEQDRERYRNERINELERRIERRDEEIWKRLFEIERALENDAAKAVADGVGLCKNT